MNTHSLTVNYFIIFYTSLVASIRALNILLNHKERWSQFYNYYRFLIKTLPKLEVDNRKILALFPNSPVRDNQSRKTSYIWGIERGDKFKSLMLKSLRESPLTLVFLGRLARALCTKYLKRSARSSAVEVLPLSTWPEASSGRTLHVYSQLIMYLFIR
jgi:hypothetical protein